MKQLPTRAYNALRRRGYATDEAVARATDAQLSALWGIGVDSLRAIRQRIPHDSSRVPVNSSRICEPSPTVADILEPVPEIVHGSRE